MKSQEIKIDESGFNYAIQTLKKVNDKFIEDNNKFTSISGSMMEQWNGSAANMASRRVDELNKNFQSAIKNLEILITGMEDVLEKFQTLDKDMAESYSE